MRIAVVLVLLLGGCGGRMGTSFPVTEGDTGHEVGRTTCCGIEIREGMSHAWKVAVLRHEIGHALGLDHVESPDCVMYFGVGLDERFLCSPVPKTRIELVSGEHYYAALEAAAWWNEHGANVAVR